MLETEIAVVGAGPAGLSAALQASLAGATVTLLDEYARPGGQYFKQPPAAFKLLDRSAMGRDYRAGQDLMGRIERDTVHLLTGTMVWGAFDSGVLELYRDGRCERLRAQRIVVATGAYDRAVAFPGWTLPGVMTAGAAQTLVKSQWVLPGSRILLAGSGPFLLPVAAQLVRAGATVVALLEASHAGDWLRGMPAVWRHLDKITEAKDYLGTLLKARVPMRYGWSVVEARGTDRVEQAVIGQVDGDGHPIPGSEEVLEVDAICTGFGFIPSLQLPRLLGCEARWDAELAAWVSASDRDQRGTVPGVFVAGETTGIGGHDVAIEEGAVAGAMAAADLGRLTRGEAESSLGKVRGELSRHRQFSAFLNRTFSFKPGYLDLMRDDTILCRCEEVTAGDVARAAKDWDGSLRTIKQLTRAGMGPCQGRICGSLVAQVAARESGRTMEQIGVDTPRPPIKPIPIGALAAVVL